MINATLSQESIELLQSLKNKRLLSYEYNSGSTMTYGKFRIHLEDQTIDIDNDTIVLPNTDTRIAILTCKENREVLQPNVLADIRMIDINDTIQSIEIITDKIELDDTILFDLAIIFQLERSTIMFSKDKWYLENIRMSTHDDIDKIYPIETVIQDWSSNQVLRTRRIL